MIGFSKYLEILFNLAWCEPLEFLLEKEAEQDELQNLFVFFSIGIIFEHSLQ